VLDDSIIGLIEEGARARHEEQDEGLAGNESGGRRGHGRSRLAVDGDLHGMVEDN
jgi:hypothetical protein